MPKKVLHDIANVHLAPVGTKKIEWSWQNMPVLQQIRDEFISTKPLKGVKIGACLHITAETANLVSVLSAGGATVALCASNPLSTQNMVAASLVTTVGAQVFAIHGEDKKTYYKHLSNVLDSHPNIILDDGADLVTLLHTQRKNQIPDVIGCVEQSITGVRRLRAMHRDGLLNIPVLAINGSDTNYLFDNRYGTGQSTLDGIIRATNILLAGKRVVVSGYGRCASGIAQKARGLGAIVTVTEVDPMKALEAAMDGFNIDQIGRAVTYGDIFITATGNKMVIATHHMKRMKDGAIIANSGHFNVEFDYEGLVRMSKSKQTLRTALEEIELPSGKRIFVVGEGRLVNLVSGEGHPADVMDISFANQALASIWFLKRIESLSPKVYSLPKEIDKRIARLKLRAMGMHFDRLTSVQRKYLHSWQDGT